MRSLLIVGLLVAVALSGCSGSSDSTTSSTTSSTTTSGGNGTVMHTPKTVMVSMQGNAFTNASVMIYQGDSVEWAHNDGATTAHTVTADDGSFDSSPNCTASGTPGVPLGQVCMVGGDHFGPRKFDAVGTVAYHCKVHGNMKGTIMVMAHPMA